MPPKKKAGKKNDDDWDDAAAEKKLAALSLAPAEEQFSEESEDEAPPPPPPKGKAKAKMSAFMMMEDSESEKSDSEAEAAPVVKAAPVPKKETKKAPAKDNKNKKNKGKKDNDEDDLDALLEEFGAPAVAATKDTGKGKKKGKKGGSEEPTEIPAEAEKPAAESEPAAAEEKKPDVEEEKAEGGDAEGKKKKKKKKKGGDKEATAIEGAAEGDEKKEDGEAEGEEGEGKKKKKKDKKKKEEEKPKKKKHVDMIKELLRAKQEAEEAELKRIKEEEERLEALQKQKEEEDRIAREKKEAEKQRKKEKEEQLKREGKWLTPAQRAKQAQAAARLASMGIDIDKIKDDASKKKVNYGDKRKQQKQQPAKVEPVPAPEKKVEEPTPPAEPAVKEEEQEEVWDDDEDVVDDWEMADVDDIKAPPPAIVETSPSPDEPSKKEKAAAVEKKESKDDEESSSEDESESESDESSEESSEEEEEVKGKETKEEKMEKVRQRLKKRRELADSNRSTDILRAPVICVLGHVDTGKTKMLDTIRRTNVQDGEAGGITQQIGATQVPGDAIKERCKNVRDFDGDKMKIPGFLIIDTPGHESFSNLRSRGSSLCDFAILVVDIMHGLEPQTIESLKLLLKRNTPFVIALNKIDRLYGYESNPRKDVYAHLKSQGNNTQLEFKERYEKIVTEFAEQGINVVLSNQNKNLNEYVSIVPTSAFLGDGVGNIMAYIAMTTQTVYANKLAFSEELDCTVMEVKALSGMGTTIDVILVNGRLRVGDIIVLTGTDGAIMTQIRDLLMPQPLKELRVKNEYEHFKEIKGAQGVKILAKSLEKALAGLPMYVAHKEEEIDVLKGDSEAHLSKALTSIKKKSEGVYVQASTLGSLEALLEFLKSQKIPYSNVNIGPVHKKDVQKASVMLEHKAEYACILAFDVRIEKDAQQFADHEGVKIFQADIIYHLEDNFLKYREELRQKARRENEHLAIFPCKLRVLPQHVFNARNPIVCGVSVEAGQLKRGTPICVPSKDCIFLGNVSSIQRNHEEVAMAKAGEEVCIKIENTTGEAPKLYGRHFTHEDALVSRISRESIDACKSYFRDDLSTNDWKLVVSLKRLLDIM